MCNLFSLFSVVKILIHYYISFTFKAKETDRFSVYIIYSIFLLYYLLYLQYFVIFIVFYLNEHIKLVQKPNIVYLIDLLSLIYVVI